MNLTLRSVISLYPVSHESRLTYLARASIKHCPRCGSGGLFAGWLAMAATCPRCGITFERDPGYWLGAMIINTAVTIGVFLAVFSGAAFATWPDVPWSSILIATMILNVVVPVTFYPWSKTLFVALDLSVRPYSESEIQSADERL